MQNYLGSLYVNDINLGTQVNRVTVQAAGVSSREVIDECVRILDKDLPHGFAYAWGNLTFHEMRGVGNTGLMAMVATMLIYLILVGRFNSWRGPLVTVLPVAGVTATVAAGLCLADAVMSIHSQVAILVFALLAVKSAVLQMEAGEPLRAVSANFVAMVAVAACDLVLAFSSGAGRCALHAVGAAAFFGAIGVALFVPILVSGLSSFFSRGRR